MPSIDSSQRPRDVDADMDEMNSNDQRDCNSALSSTSSTNEMILSNLEHGSFEPPGIDETEFLSSVQTESAQPQDGPSQQNATFSIEVETLEASAAYNKGPVHAASTDTGESAYQIDPDYVSRPKHENNVQQQQTEQQGVEPNDPLDDTNTVYSVDSSISDGKMHPCTLEFANAVVRELLPGIADKDTIGLLCGKLPDAIRAFALRIGGRNSTQSHRNIMCLTHKYRR